MNRVALNVSLGVAVTVAALHAQNPLSDDARASYQIVRVNILKAAEKMPDSEYGFRPTPEVRTFRELIAHVAETQMVMCGVAKGEPKRVDAASKAAKPDVIAELKSSNEFCDGVFNAMSDEVGTAAVKTPFGQKPKLGVLNLVVAHGNETYGMIALYLRLKGIVPPSSEGK